MAEQISGVYSFRQFRLDAAERQLFEGSAAVQLAPKVFDTLMLLVANGGKVVSKERMVDEIWEGSFVEENNLAQNISLLRRLLGETSDTRFIETVPKYGYRFICPVETDCEGVTTEIFEQSYGRIYIDDGQTSQALPARAGALKRHKPVTQYAQNGDVNIAYQVVG